MKAIQFFKKDFFNIILFFLLLPFAVYFIHFFILSFQDFFINHSNHFYHPNLTIPNVWIVISGAVVNFILFNWLAIQIKNEKNNVFDNISNLNTY